METVYSEIFTSGFHSNKIKYLKPPYKIWARIFLGCIFHRKPSNSPDYINNEQLYLLYCIGKDLKVDLPHLLFDHLWNHVKETREPAKSKSLKVRDWIPMGRLISNILTENGLVAHLTEAGQTEELKAIVGKSLDGKSLQRMKLVEKLQYEPVQMNSETVRNRRVPVEDFPLFTTEEPVEALMAFIESCMADGIPLPANMLEQASQPAPDFIEKKKRKKRKVSEEGSPKKKSKHIKKKGISFSDTSVLKTVITPTSQPTPYETIPSFEPTPSEPHQQISSDYIPYEPEKPHLSEPTVSEPHQTTPSETQHTLSSEPIQPTPSEHQ